MKKPLLVVAVAAIAVPALAQQPVATTAATKSLKIGDDWFVKKGSPSTITVKAGTKVTWKWTGHAPHDVSVVKGPKIFRSGDKVKGTYSVKVTKKGTYKIVCFIHQPDMRMTLKVK